MASLELIASGKTYSCEAILLHSEEEVRTWQKMTAEVDALLGEFSTGLGILGSPTVVITSAAALRLLEAAVTNAKRKKGIRLLADATVYLEDLESRGIFVAVDKIRGLKTPNPYNWSAEADVDAKIDLRQLGMVERIKFFTEHQISKDEDKDGYALRRMRKSVITLPHEFITFQTTENIVRLRWSAIEAYIIK